MNRFFVGLIVGVVSVVGGTYFYHTKIKKEIDEKGVFHRTFFGGKLKVDIRNNENEENNNASVA